MYKSLNDAANISPIFAPGNVKIWYVNNNLPSSIDFRFGRIPKDLIENLDNTHVLLGSIKGSSNTDEIFEMMQGENWSPNGEARDLIKNSGTYHTSMSIGDVIEFENGIFYLVNDFGFEVY